MSEKRRRFGVPGDRSIVIPMGLSTAKVTIESVDVEGRRHTITFYDVDFSIPSGQADMVEVEPPPPVVDLPTRFSRHSQHYVALRFQVMPFGDEERLYQIVEEDA